MRAEKELLLNEIKEKIDQAKALIVTRYQKLEPNLSWQMRDLLSKQGSLYEVVRKRVFMKAAEKAGIQIADALLDGNIGVMFIAAEEPMKSTKAIKKFSEENGDILEILCGQIEGKILPGAEIKQLAELPGIDEMRAILLGLFTSPLSQTLAVIDAIMAGPLSVLEQKSTN